MALEVHASPVASREEMERCAEITITAFASEHIAPVILGPNTPENIAKVGKTQMDAAAEHAASFPSVPSAIKCTLDGTIVGSAKWVVYDQERRTEAEWRRENYLNRLEYVDDKTQREKCLEFMRPMVEARQNMFKGRRYGFLIFMAVDEQYRRKGAATACVRWGMNKCKELGIPAYLEASEEGMKVYQGMGWEVVKTEGMIYPGMVWWPEGVERYNLE